MKLNTEISIVTVALLQLPAFASDCQMWFSWLLPTTPWVSDSKVGRGATEGYDEGYDMEDPGRSYVDLYSLVEGHRLVVDPRPLETTSFYTNELDGVNIPYSIDGTLSFSCDDPSNDLQDKVMQLGVWQYAQGMAVLVAHDDFRALVANSTSLPLTVSNGHCYDIELRMIRKDSSIPRLSCQSYGWNTGKAGIDVDGVLSGESVVLEQATDVSGQYCGIATNYVTPTIANFGIPTRTSFTNVLAEPPRMFYRARVE